MKTSYFTFFFVLISILSFSQGYEFALVNTSGYNFKVIAIPNFDSTGDTDVSNIGFTLMLPAGSADVINQVNLLVNGTWSVDQYNAATLSGAGAGDGTRDAFLFTLPPGQNLLSHTSGVPIDLVSFEVSNNPVAGIIEFLPNNDPINTALGNALDSFYQSNIDASSTQDYFIGLAVGQESFILSTLNAIELLSEDIRILVYPNPTSDYITIKSKLIIDHIEFFDLLGKRILKKSSNTSLIDLSKLSEGTYVLKMYNKKESYTTKIVKD